MGVEKDAENLIARFRDETQYTYVCNKTNCLTNRPQNNIFDPGANYKISEPTIHSTGCYYSQQPGHGVNSAFWQYPETYFDIV